MQKRLLRWELIGFAFTGAVGTLLHFVYEWTGGNPLIAAFCAVNESTWEHMKLLFVPFFLFTMVEFIVFAEPLRSFFAAKAASILLGLLAIPVLFYSLGGMFGKTPDWVNIAIFFLADALLYFMSRGDAPGSVPEYRNEPEYRMFDRIIRGCMEKEKEARYQSADELQETLQELQNQLKEQAAESRIVVFAGAAAGIGTTHAALGMSHFLTRNGCPALYQEAYDTSAVRTLAKNMGIKTDRTGVYRIGCGSIRPYYGEAVKLPYLYFPVIIKDAGVIRSGRELPGADFYVLVCGGKWWEIDRAVNAAKMLKSRGKVILLFNHMEKKARLKLPKVLSDIHYFFLPFFSNPFREDKAANTCYRDLWNDGTGETRWKRKKLSQRLRRSDAE